MAAAATQRAPRERGVAIRPADWRTEAERFRELTRDEADRRTAWQPARAAILENCGAFGGTGTGDAGECDAP